MKNKGMKSNNSAVVSVVKGEIHILLGVLRQQHGEHLRFHEEILQYDYHSSDEFKSRSVDDNEKKNDMMSTNIYNRRDLISNLRRLNETVNTRVVTMVHTDDDDDDDVIIMNDSPYRCNIKRHQHLNEGIKAFNANSYSHIQLDALTMVQPFCAAVSLADMNAQVTGAALSSLHKFVLYKFLTLDMPGIKSAISLIAQSIRHCTFESTVNSQLTRGRSSIIQQMREQEEQVVLKLLSLSSVIVRCQASTLLSSPEVFGIFETCLHVTTQRDHPASQLLRSAAADALAHIVLVVSSSSVDVGNNVPVRSLMYSDNEIKQFDIASEHQGLHRSPSHRRNIPALVMIFEQLVRMLDPRSNPSHDSILSLTLINIALEGASAASSSISSYSNNEELVDLMRNDMCKHLLLLSTHSDLRIYSLTLRVIFNLFNSIKDQMKVQLEVFLTSVHLRVLERKNMPELCELTLESLLEFCQEPALMQDLYLNYDCDVHCTNLFESICRTLASQAIGESNTNDTDDSSDSLSNDDSIRPVTVLNRLALEGVLAVIDAISSRCTEQRAMLVDDKSETLVDEPFTPTSNKPSDEMLQMRKLQKQNLSQVVNAFNATNDWIPFAQNLGMFPANSKPTANEVARFLYNTPQLNKTKIGLYLSKGPIEKYPFNNEVLLAFTNNFEFRGMEFSDALRLFLAKFKLPGEAQCIDRLMECFAKELFSQQRNDQEIYMFKNADAVYILAFSTIMLNTDLHNPNMEDDRRMTLPEFIRNNRGINDGENLPDDFLTNLYNKIKEEEIQVHHEDLLAGAALDDAGELKWDDDKMKQKTKQVATPFFTPSDAASSFPASLHEQDMLTSISPAVLESMSSIFFRTRDDNLIMKILRGFQQICKACVYFNLPGLFNEVVSLLLGDGREYVLDASILMTSHLSKDTFNMTEDIPNYIVNSEEIMRPDLNFGISNNDCKGAAAHRGLLSLYLGLHLVREHEYLIDDTWSIFVDCLFALRDAKALPSSLVELDDFADSNGVKLPPTRFATKSRTRWEKYISSMMLTDNHNNQKGLWESMTNVIAPPVSNDIIEEEMNNQRLQELKRIKKALLNASQNCESIIMKKRDIDQVKNFFQALLDAVDPSTVGQYIDSPLFEYHAVFALELSARVLLCHRKSAATVLYPLIFAKFRIIIGGGYCKKIPYLVERSLVTILRSCIHLLDVVELRPLLFSSLELLEGVPEFLLEHISSRMACGMAIILLGSLSTLESKPEWALVIRLLHTAAKHSVGRKIVLDGIASCVEMCEIEEWHAFNSYGKLLCIDMLSNNLSGGDISHCLLAMNLLQSLFFTSSRSCEDSLWLSVALSYYETSLSSNSTIAQHAIECLQKHIVAIHNPDDLSKGTWIKLYEKMILDRPPSLTRSKVRTTCLIILSRSLLLVLPSCSSSNKMTAIIEGLATMIRENISGRHDGLLFESTVQHVTNMINVTELLIQSTHESNESNLEFLLWTVQCLRAELENVGRAGGCIASRTNPAVVVSKDNTTSDKESNVEQDISTLSGESSSEQNLVQ